jgi:hypothetical protein
VRARAARPASIQADTRARGDQAGAIMLVYGIAERGMPRRGPVPARVVVDGIRVPRRM